MTARQQAAAAVLLAALAYAVIGIGSGALAAAALSPAGRDWWRRAAFAVSAVVFLAHLWYDAGRLPGSAARIALRVGGAVALGGFVLAAAANLHSLHGAPLRLRLSLVIWPLLVGIPAFVAALVLARLARRPAST